MQKKTPAGPFLTRAAADVFPLIFMGVYADCAALLSGDGRPLGDIFLDEGVDLFHVLTNETGQVVFHGQFLAIHAEAHLLLVAKEVEQCVETGVVGVGLDEHGNSFIGLLKVVLHHNIFYPTVQMIFEYRQ